MERLHAAKEYCVIYKKSVLEECLEDIFPNDLKIMSWKKMQLSGAFLWKGFPQNDFNKNIKSILMMQKKLIFEEKNFSIGKDEQLNFYKALF